jgi:aryl-phospho-beta-D-glucosidase BglC (GH1 family)
VDGNKIRDPSGREVILRGLSMMNIGQQEINGGLEWMVDKVLNPEDDGGGVDGWYTKVIRLPVYPPVVGIDPSNPPAHPFPFSDSGSETNEQFVEDFLRPIVDYTESRGLYAIIDFHQIADVSNSTDQEAQSFWSFVAPRFADYANVIFEVFNEPMYVNGDNSWGTFKPYAQAWVDIIRQAAPDNLILVGGPMWAQNIGGAAGNPISGGNIAYVSHIYPEHWGSGGVQREAETCAAAHPVFVTEWGFDNDDSGFRDTGGYASGIKNMIDSQGMSWTAWVLSRDWLPRMLTGSLSAFELTDFGEFAKEWLYEERNNDLPQ